MHNTQNFLFYSEKSPFWTPKTLKTYSFFKNLLLLFKCEGGLGPLGYPNDSNIARANYYFLGHEMRELFEI